MGNDEIERQAELLLGYFNQQAIDRIVAAVLDGDEAKRALRTAVLKLIPTLFSEELQRSVTTWMHHVLKKMAEDGRFWAAAEGLVRAAMDKHIEAVVDQLVQNELKHMAREAIRAQLKKGL